MDIDDGSDVEYLDIGEDLDTEPIKKDDIAEFIEQLGIKKQRPDTGLVYIKIDVCDHFVLFGLISGNLLSGLRRCMCAS